MPDICMPSLGADMDAGTVVEWKISVGDHVSRGDVVGLVETQKATMELESFEDGTVVEILVEVATKVAVGTPLVRLASDAGQVIVHATPSAPSSATMPVAAPLPPPPTRLRSSPAARQRARELAIDLSTVHGSGPHGAILLRDVVAPPVVPPTPPSRPPRRASPVAGPMREAIAVAMSRSKREIPHFYLSHTISMKRSLAFLTELDRTLPIQERILPGAMLLRAVAVALWDFPELNGFYFDGGFRPSEQVHLATAISLRTGGLIAPAILDADRLSLAELMRELQDLVTRARAGRLKSTELTSATITVTSLGDRGCEAVFPVIAPPQVAIVGFGAIATRPWVEDDAIAPHPTVVATLAADHRVSDGHRGALFLSALDHLLQEPAKL